MKKLINVYCDESCHLQKDESSVMALGALYCDAENVKTISERVRTIKKKHGLPRLFETKWTKVSATKLAYYEDLVEFFFKEAPLKFRGLLIPDKSKLDHDRHNQSHDEWYYKMYYILLQWLTHGDNKYHFYLDIKDTLGAAKTATLQKYLAHHIHDYSFECVARVQQVRSHEVELLQLADLIIGALAYANKNKKASTAKEKIIKKIKENLPNKSLSKSTSYTETKFNLFVWEARKL